MASTSWSGVRFGHGRDVYDELIHVPLIIWGSIDESLAGRRVAEAVEVRSVAHTLAKLAQVPDNIFQAKTCFRFPELPVETGWFSVKAVTPWEVSIGSSWSSGRVGN